MISWPTLENISLNYGGVAVYEPGATFGPRHLYDFEFVWITEGEAVAHFDEVAIPAPADTVLLCRKGTTDRYDWGTTRKSIHAFFHFDFKLPSGWPPLETWPQARLMPGGDILRPLFRYVLRMHVVPKPLRNTLLLPAIDLMVRSFVSGELATAADPPADLPPPMEKALQLVRDTIYPQLQSNRGRSHASTRLSEVSLSQLADAAHVTPEHLCRLFQRHLGRSPLECVRLARLQLAATLLGRSNTSIKEIADVSGFGSPYYFSRAFRQTYQVSPRQYREALRRGKDVRHNPITRVLPLPT